MCIGLLNSTSHYYAKGDSSSIRLKVIPYPDKDGFILVKGGWQSKKRKADGSPLFHSPWGASSASPINTPARPRPSTYKNSILIILSDVDPKFNSVVKLMSELRQFHPSLRVSKVQELKNNRFLVIGDTS